MLRSVAIRFLAQICGAVLVATPFAMAQEPPAERFLAYAGNGAEPRISNFSGLPVPRYSSIKNAPANGRAGPSQDYPVRWQYQLKGLPVVIIRETADWRKIRDPQGDEVWIHRALLSGETTAITMYDGQILQAPREDAEVLAQFPSGLVLALDRCEGAWCAVSADGVEGWVSRTRVWGAESLNGTP